MARGIVVTKPGGGMPNGKIIVSDGSSVITPAGGGGAVAADPGTVVPYVEDSAELGDVVDFTYDGRLASALQTAIKGTVITGPYTDNVVVGLGECYLITGGNLEGKISVNGGILVVVGNSYLTGKVESATAGSFILFNQQSTVEGKLDISGASTLSYRNSTVEGKLTTNGTLFTAVNSSTIHGKLEVLNAKICQCIGNTVVGDTNTPGCTA
jgi:hypothetical protein